MTDMVLSQVNSSIEKIANPDAATLAAGSTSLRKGDG